MQYAQSAVKGHQEATALADAYQRASDTSHRAVREAHTEWVVSMDASVLRGLSQPLLAVVRAGQLALLRVDMDPALQTALTEV